MPNSAKAQWLAPLLLGGMVVLAVLAGGAAGWLEPVELWWYDALVRRHSAAGPTSEAVVLVGISEEDIRVLNTWPPPDRLVGDLLTRILEGQPRAIGLDLYRDIPVPPGTEALGEVLGGDGRIVAVETFGGDGGRAPGVLDLVKLERQRVCLGYRIGLRPCRRLCLWLSPVNYSVYFLYV